MAKRLSQPETVNRTRLDWDASKQTALDMAAASAGLSVASFARLALELLIEKKAVTLEEVRKEADRLTGQGEPAAPAKPVPAAKKPKTKK